MRKVIALAAPLFGLILAAGAGVASTVFEESFQDDIISAFMGQPFETVPIDQTRPVIGVVEAYTDPVLNTPRAIAFVPTVSGSLAVGRRNFCLSGCAQFSLNGSYQLRSDFRSPLLEIGQDYRLSVTLRLINGSSPQAVSAIMGLSASQGGATRAEERFDLFNSGSFATYALDIDGDSLNGAPVEYVLGFALRGPSGSGIYIDEILLESIAAPVPLPASGALLIGGIAAVVGVRRRVKG